MDFKNITFAIEFRSYQKEMLSVFDKLHSEGDRRFHFIAPPGSGKTIMGLEIIRRLGKRAVIFSPNSAIQIQWQEKLKGLTDELSISTNPYSDADILSLCWG